MSAKSITVAQLSAFDYVPVMKDLHASYGGSQMWFPDRSRFSKDYILHQYGCGTIATADLLLYLAIQKPAFRTPLTALALKQEGIVYTEYTAYVKTIHKQFTKTLPVLALLGPVAAAAINSYSGYYGLGLHASWKWKLNYYDMYDLIEEMLENDIPVILSIGPNTPKLWGKKGITFYEFREIAYQSEDSKKVTTPSDAEHSVTIAKPYYYKPVKQDITGHYVTVTGLVKDDLSSRIMLKISSWGKPYYINYEEYRDYVENIGGTYTSSLIHIYFM